VVSSKTLAKEHAQPRGSEHPHHLLLAQLRLADADGTAWAKRWLLAAGMQDWITHVRRIVFSPTKS